MNNRSKLHDRTPLTALQPQKHIKEGYAYIDTTKPTQWGVTPIERVAPMDGDPYEILPNGKMSGTQPLTMSLEEKFAQAKADRADNSKSCTPITNLLFPETSTMVYTDEFFEQPNSRLFLQTIGPNEYSYSVDTTPINALANGITYMPQRPPKFMDQVYTRANGLTWPIYTRVDPQLIREDGMPARLLEQPVRGDWSANYANWLPPEGSINYEDIYDPRFTGYGPGTRAYSDVNLGQVQYYYSDVDVYRYPNFVTRSKIDFIEFTDPMGRVKPYYIRESGLNDARPYVENQFMNDTTYFRQNLMEEQSRAANARNWQARQAPLSRAAHARTFTSGQGGPS